MRKRRTGSRPRFHLVAWLVAGLVLAAPVLADKKDKRAADYAVVAGTVFRESGMALPGAEVTLTSAPGVKGKKVKLKAVSDSRGEFSFHVPPVAASYVVAAQAQGYQRQEKAAAIASDERIDVFFRLERADESKEH